MSNYKMGFGICVITAIMFLPEIQAQGSVQCNSLYIERGWPEIQADGVYNLTTESCSEFGEDPLPVYLKTTQPRRYLYQRPDRHWYMYDQFCSVTHWGETPVTDWPWITGFQPIPNTNTSIICLDYEGVVWLTETDKEGEWTMPSLQTQQNSLLYKLTVNLPENANSVNFTINTNGGSCDHGTIMLTGEDPLCFDGVKRDFVRYFSSSDEKKFTLTVAYYRQNAVDYPVMDLTYKISHYEELVTATTQRTSVPEDVTTYPHDVTTNSNDVTTYADDVTTYGDYVTTNTISEAAPRVTSQTTDGALVNTSAHSTEHIWPDIGPTTRISISPDQSTTEDDYVYSGDYEDTSREPIFEVSDEPDEFTYQPDPCDGLMCMAGLACEDGKCPCPTSQQCDDHSDLYQPVCYQGNTYRSSCHVRAHACRNVLMTDDIVTGPCPQSPDGSTVEPPAGSVLDPGHNTGWPTYLTVIIAFAAFVCFIAIIVVSILCIRKREKRSQQTISMRPADDETPIMQNNRQFRPMSATPPAQADNSRRSTRPFSRSSNSSFRASPKSKRRSAEPAKVIDPDRFSLSGCITPLNDMTDNPLTTFTASHHDEPISGNSGAPSGTPDNAPNGSPPQHGDGQTEPRTDGDSGILVQLEQEQPASPAECPTARNVPQKRENPPARHTSATESAVYELHVDPSVMESISPVQGVTDDSHLSTRL